jgi:hypothetical protein
MSSSRLHFNRTLFTVPLTLADTEELVALLEAEDVELVLDARASGPSADLSRLCSEAAMYYVYERGLAAAVGVAEPDKERTAASAAHLALRHRTCVVADEKQRRDIADTVASVVGMRVLDIAESPAAVALPAHERRL